MKKRTNCLATLDLDIGQITCRKHCRAVSGAVAIARSLMNDPEIILADEPTASLDSKRGRDVVEMLAHEVKSRNKAAIMVTHDERMLDLCDRVVNITDGKVFG